MCFWILLNPLEEIRRNVRRASITPVPGAWYPIAGTRGPRTSLLLALDSLQKPVKHFPHVDYLRDETVIIPSIDHFQVECELSVSFGFSTR